MGGDDADAATKVASQLSYVNEHLESIYQAINNETELMHPMINISNQLQALQDVVEG